MKLSFTELTSIHVLLKLAFYDPTGAVVNQVQVFIRSVIKYIISSLVHAFISQSIFDGAFGQSLVWSTHFSK
ncbi:MAG TPA: hypothetical protein EYP59_09685 [Thiotrichaceae bacterium]|nr:hypothetical protein [Thiotrichaceae bacterium]